MNTQEIVEKQNSRNHCLTKMVAKNDSVMEDEAMKISKHL